MVVASTFHIPQVFWARKEQSKNCILKKSKKNKSQKIKKK